MRIILHIGSEKTGSTSVQEALDRNRLLLSSHGIFYPEYPHDIANHFLKPLFFGDLEIGHPLHEGYLNARDRRSAFCWREWQRIETQVKELRPDTLVLSCETLFQVLGESADEIVKRLVAMSSDIEIVAYLRSPESFVVSSASQSFKHSLTLDLTALGRKLDYSGIIASYERKFDRSVSVYTYEESGRVSGSIVGHFFEKVLKIRLCDDANKIFWNVTPSPESLEIIQLYFSRFYRKRVWSFNEADYKDIDGILRIEKALGKAPIVLTDFAKQWTRAHIRGSAGSTQALEVNAAISCGYLTECLSSGGGKVNLRDFFVLDENRRSAILAKIEVEMPLFWAAYGATHAAGFWRARLRIRRYLRTLRGKLRRASGW